MRQVGCSRQPASRTVDEIPDGTHNEHQENDDHNDSENATVTSKAMTLVLFAVNMTLNGESADFVAKSKNKIKINLCLTSRCTLVGSCFLAHSED